MIHLILTIIGGVIGTLLGSIVNPDTIFWWGLCGAIIGLFLSFGNGDIPDFDFD